VCVALFPNAVSIDPVHGTFFADLFFQAGEALPFSSDVSCYSPLSLADRQPLLLFFPSTVPRFFAEKIELRLSFLVRGKLSLLPALVDFFLDGCPKGRVFPTWSSRRIPFREILPRDPKLEGSLPRFSRRRGIFFPFPVPPPPPRPRLHRRVPSLIAVRHFLFVCGSLFTKYDGSFFFVGQLYSSMVFPCASP